MRKGIVRIISGLFLITLQALSIIGNLKSGAGFSTSSVTLGQLTYNIVFYASYFSVGIIGFLLFISGLCAFFEIRFPARKQIQKAGVSTSEQHYCKLCGGTVDATSKKCTQCGKQYLRIRFSKFSVFITVIVIVAVAFLSLYISQTEKYQQEIARLNSRIVDLENANQEKEKAIKQLEKDLASKTNRYEYVLSVKEELESDINFFNEHVVFVPDDSRTYHRYDCILFKYNYRIDSDSAFLAYNTKTAKQKGYKPCWYCLEE